MNAVKIDIWSDVACPWCYIGKRRLESALERVRETVPDLAVELEYHSFQLSPDMPVDYPGSELDFLVSHKGMGEAQVREMLDTVTRIARLEGLDYDFEALVPTNTGAALELLHHARAHGRQVEMKERLFRAHFVEGRHVGRLEDLADLAAEVGLDRDDALRALQDGNHRDDVRADQIQATRLGISGVPFHVIDGRYGLSGAQSADTFVEAITRALADRQEATSR